MIDQFLAWLGLTPEQWWVLIVMPSGFVLLVFLLFTLGAVFPNGSDLDDYDDFL